MSWSDKISLVEALLGLPTKRPGQYEDVIKLARIAGLVSFTVGYFALVEGYGFLLFCMIIVAGSLVGGCIALWLRRIGVPVTKLAKTSRRSEIAGCATGVFLTILCIIVSILRPNAITIFGIFFFAWGAIRYFHRQQAVARSPESSWWHR